jgi:hypothetical protein
LSVRVGGLPPRLHANMEDRGGLELRIGIEL